MLRAIVFDFDGVIVNSEPMHHRAFADVLRSVGCELTWRQYCQRYIGYDDRDLFRHYLADAGRSDLLADDAALHDLVRQKGEAFVAVIDRACELTPGLDAFIEDVAARAPIAIASGATRRDIELVLGRLGWLDRFSVIVSADDVARSKPDPQTYRLAYEALAQDHDGASLQPGDCLAIEDTAAGIHSARGAGLMTLGLSHWTKADALRDAHRVVDDFQGLSFEQLRQWFD